MQQGGASHSRYGGTPSSAPESSSPPTAAHHHHHHGLIVEEASPISSRPPAPDNIEQLRPDIDAFAAEDTNRGGGGGNRWPKQETVALLQIRSDMDAAFRDASLKGPLWEHVSRKMGKAGYKRSGKKCKEKFENVHKYYKRTKEGRVGRQDGKTYKFFSELEALQIASPLQPAMTLPPPPPTTPSLNLPPASPGIQFANPGVPAPSMASPPTVGMQPPTVSYIFPATVAPASSPRGLIFSSNSSSSSPGSEDYKDDVEGQPSPAVSGRKRKRVGETSSGSEGRRMAVHLEGLMKRVTQRQEEMHKRFLEAIEKREQDRLAREEAWRRQEMAQLSHEQELMAQDRVVSASRDAAIMSFLQKITDQTIQLPSIATVTAVPVVSPRPLLPSQAPAAAPPPSRMQQRNQQPQRQPQPPSPMYQSPPPVYGEVPPLKEIIRTSGRGDNPWSSRWPKEEVLALIRLRSGMELKHEEVGAKGQLWEEISGGMQRLGYKRNPKRCKEKWENINKYFKKVKEGNKKRPEEAKTCPYFHELDALHRKKVLGTQTGRIEIRLDAGGEAQRGGVLSAADSDSERMKNRGPGEDETESVEKQEDTVKELNHRLEQQEARVVDLGG